MPHYALPSGSLPPSLLPSPVAHSLLNGHQRKQRAAHSSTVAHCTAWFQYIFTSYNTNTKRQNTSNTHILHHTKINMTLDRHNWEEHQYAELPTGVITSKDILLQWNLWVFTGVQIWLQRVIGCRTVQWKIRPSVGAAESDPTAIANMSMSIWVCHLTIEP